MTAILLRDRGRHTREESKTVRALSFEVPAGVDGLSLKFDYGPRFCDDVASNRPLVEAAFERYLSTRRGRVDAAEIERVRAALNVDERAKRLHNLMNVTLIDPTAAGAGVDRNPSSASGESPDARARSRGFCRASSGRFTRRVPRRLRPWRWTGDHRAGPRFLGRRLTGFSLSSTPE